MAHFYLELHDCTVSEINISMKVIYMEKKKRKKKAAVDPVAYGQEVN